MGTRIYYKDAQKMIVESLKPVGTEQVPLQECAFRVLSQEVKAEKNVPSFDRSPLDGYAFRAADTAQASPETPAVLKVLDNVPAGEVSCTEVGPGTAVRLMTGAPVPAGADAITKYEETEFSEKEVRIFKPFKPGKNIIYAGEDVKKGTVLAWRGQMIDPGLMGTLAGQNIAAPEVFRKLRVGILSTGSELLEVGSDPEEGMVFDTNSHTLHAMMEQYHFQPVRYGITKDRLEDIAAVLRGAIEECDAVILTGGASVGDYDLSPKAMEAAGVTTLFKNAAIKPGGACSYGIKDNKLVCSLPGNPASSITNMYVLGIPGLKKLAGWKDCIPEEIRLTMANAFNKEARNTRILSGRMDIIDGKAMFTVFKGQGNVILSGLIGCNCLGIMEPDDGPLEKGAELRGILL